MIVDTSTRWWSLIIVFQLTNDREYIISHNTMYALYYPHSIVKWIGLPFSNVSPPSIVRWWRLWVSRRRMKMPISCASKWRRPPQGIHRVAQNMVNKTMDFMSEDGKLHVLFLFPGLTVMICGKMVVFTSNHSEFYWFNDSKRRKFGEGPSEMRDISIRRLVQTWLIWTF